MPSKLLITGGDDSLFGPAFASAATMVSLDLEDTVPDGGKAAVRALIPRFLEQGRRAGCSVAVRISPLSTPDGLKDIQLLLQSEVLPDSLILTKVQSAPEVVILDQLLQGRCRDLPFSVIVETPLALAQVENIARASPRVTSLSFGGKDLSMATRMARQWEPLLYARSRIVSAAAAAGLDVFDEPFHPRDDLEGLRENCRRVRALGFTGKSTTDVRHPKVINEVFAG
jgi:(S)-citramalyl-CoA lyase